MSSDFRDNILLRVATLSQQEQETLELLTNGASIRSIAAHFDIADAEVESVVQHMKAKLSANRTADLVRIGLEASFAQRS
jgi:FixJ family two-component response regulator